MTRASQTSRTVRPQGSRPASGGSRPPVRRRRTWLIVAAIAVVAVLAIVGVILLTSSRNDAAAPGSSTAPSGPVVGGDLHTVTDLGDALVVGGHAAAAISRDGGATWEDIPSLTNGDPMGWAVTDDAIFAGGHPGLFRSTDGGATFELGQIDGASDVHGLGGSGSTLYLASPEAGLLASTDGGASWEVRNAQVGQSFMGTILVDPEDPARLIAPDMAGGIVTSTDGGLSWTSLGGPQGAMAVTWNPADTDELVAVGMNGAARSTDGGASWEELAVPPATSAVTFSVDGGTLYAGTLREAQAEVYRSEDSGATWTPTI